MAFTDTEHSVLPMNQLITRAQHPGGNSALPGTVSLSVPANRYNYFGELKMKERSGTNLDLTYKVENQPDRSSYRFCQRGSNACQEVEMRATAEQGLLYLWHSGSMSTPIMMSGFPQQRLEVSASDATTGLKVYREVLVNPPPDVPECESDYGEATVDAYVCLYLRELIPEGAGGGANESTLRAKLPGLVQDASNYQLVFAEEFNGTPPAANSAGCRDGLSTLDDSAWNHGDPCLWVDSRGESCGNVANGSLRVAAAYKCFAGLNTFGKLHYKYGYMEFQYTINTDYWPADLNYNFIAWAPLSPEQHLWEQYGVAITDWEDFLKYSSVELDFLEYSPSSKHSSWIQHANWHYNLFTTQPAFKSGKRLDYCGPHPHSRNGNRPYWNFLVNPRPCPKSSNHTHTVTLGVEWTPRGYRTFVRWDGVNMWNGEKYVPIENELTLWHKDMIEVFTNTRDWRGRRDVTIRGDARDQYFEYLDPADPSTLLEQVGIVHTPNPLSIGTWGFPNSRNHTYIRSTLSFDYIRLWKPQNHYSDMEPVYQ
ncbi:hypothetical protein [Candidatus Poriferisocius sp.]|uniref:hypothetical protein n=1 Tax=Candidatus Poriferisocius sp. TaxID=3101276 RepID=UPI003B013788